MTRQVPVRLTGRALAVVAVALALLAVSAQPVAASHGQLTVGSEHTSTSDFESATDLSGVNVESNTVELAAIDDGFETHPAGSGVPDGWTITDSGVSANVTTARAASGEQAYYQEVADPDQSHSIAVRPASHPIAPATGAISGSLYLEKDLGQADYVGFRIEGDNGGVNYLVIRNGDLQWYDSGGSWTTLSTAVDRNEWVSVEITDINPTTDSATVSWSTAATSGSETINLPLTEGYEAVKLRNWDAGGYYDDIEIGDSGGYMSQNQTVSNAQQAWTNLSLSNATASVEWQAWDAGAEQWQVVNSAQFSSTANQTLNISGYETWRVNVSFKQTGANPTAQLHDEGILVETDEPTVDNAAATPDTTSESKGAPLDLTIPVDDPDFDTSHGDTVTVDYYVDGSKVATETTSSAGDVSTTITDLDAGDHTWHVEVSDEYGHSTTSDTFQFTTASELRILDEQNPDQLVQDNVAVTVRLYADDSTVEREVTDGTLDLSGLPLNSTIVATTQADGWIDRRVLIRDLTQQQEIYLLNSSANAVAITFDLEDKTGDFPDDSSQLYVQKALNTSSTEDLEWKTVTGDFFGADGTFPTDLAYSQRYRLVIRNGSDVRVLGSYIPTEDATRTITLGEIIWDVPEGEQVVFRSNRKKLSENADDTYENASEALELKYNDSEGATEELYISVTTRDTNKTIYEVTVTDVSSYKDDVALTPEEANKSLVVNASAVRSADHENFNQSSQMGNVEEQDLPMDPQWVSLFTQLTIGALICLVAGKMPKTGGLVVLPVAFGVTWLGFWEIHPASLGFAGMIALYRASDTEGGGY